MATKKTESKKETKVMEPEVEAPKMPTKQEMFAKVVKPELLQMIKADTSQLETVSRLESTRQIYLNIVNKDMGFEESWGQATVVCNHVKGMLEAMKEWIDDCSFSTFINLRQNPFIDLIKTADKISTPREYVIAFTQEQFVNPYVQTIINYQKQLENCE